jgi:hypothetical protein
MLKFHRRPIIHMETVSHKMVIEPKNLKSQNLATNARKNMEVLN